MIVREPIEVTLVKGPDYGLISRAWTLSRPLETDPDLYKILKIDIPVNELTDITVQVYAPILIREIICTLRDHRVWARTSRVDDLTEWDVWDGVSKDLIDEELTPLYDQMMKLKNENSDQDDYRTKLPLCYMTGFTLNLSLRSYMKLCSYFKFLASNYNGKDRISVLFHDMYIKLIKVFIVFNDIDSPDKLFSSYIFSMIEDNEVKFEVLNSFPQPRDKFEGWRRNGNMINIAYPACSLALRAQIIRHRVLIVNDTLRSYFSYGKLSSPISSTMYIEISTSIPIARSIVTKRNCWISQSDIWEPIVELLNAGIHDVYTDIDERLDLPCDDNGTCPYVRDNELRLEGNDPGIPCPVFANIYKRGMTKKDHDRAYPYAAKRTSSKFWNGVLDNVLDRELVK
jgi:hypothetical protein